MKIAIFWSYLFHYRVRFYERLAREPGVHLTVFHGGEDPNTRGTEPVLRCAHSFHNVPIHTYERPIAGAVVYFQTGMWRHLFAQRFDVIVCEGNFGIISNLLIAVYSRFTNTRFVYWAGGWERKAIKGVAAGLRRRYVRLAARFADGYLCYGSKAQEFLSKYGVDPSRSTIVQNTIDTEEIQNTYASVRERAAAMKNSLGAAGKLVVLSVGVLIPRKRHDLLLEAFQTVRSTRTDVALVIVGDGPEMGRLASMVKKQRIPDVFFIGEIISDVGLYFALADLFVLPALGGLAINQAMAYGLPVICSEGDGTERDLVVSNETGLFFRKNDARDLAAKMSLLLSSQERRVAMGARARDHVNHIASMSAMVARFLGAVATPSSSSV